jgi:hypothetical protein
MKNTMVCIAAIEQLDLYRQPWYPVQERYGLVFAYLGPLDRKPPLPRYDILENVPEGCHLLADGNTIPAAGPDRMPCNWVQTYERARYARAECNPQSTINYLWLILKRMYRFCSCRCDRIIAQQIILL